MNKFVCLFVVALVCLASVESSPTKEKRSIIYGTVPLVQTVAAVPAVRTATLVHHNPTTVVKTEQVHSGDHASYSYSTEVKSQPAVVHQTVAAAAPVIAAAPIATSVVSHAVPVSTSVVSHAVPVSTVHHTIPSVAYGYGYYPYGIGSGYYSPYSYILRK